MKTAIAAWLQACFFLTAAGCTPALKTLPPAALSASAATAVRREGVDALLGEAGRRFALRPDRMQVDEARRLYLAAGWADEARTEGLVGFVTASAWAVEREKNGTARAEMVRRSIEAAQVCGERAPGSAACDYVLALALGQQSREKPATAADGLARMIEALRRTAKNDEPYDHAGAWRVLALVHLRAPGWPIGPGDTETALSEARRAVEIDPAYPPNLLVLAEALRKNDREDEAISTASRAAEEARRLAAAGHPDAPEWLTEAERALAAQ